MPGSNSSHHPCCLLRRWECRYCGRRITTYEGVSG